MFYNLFLQIILYFNSLFRKKSAKDIEEQELKEKYKNNPDYLKTCYSHNESTPLLMDSELQSKYLSRLNLSDTEKIELQEVLDKRREIMDRRGVYDFNKAWMLEEQEYKQRYYETEYPTIYNWFLNFKQFLEKRRIIKKKYVPKEVRWEEWKESRGYYEESDFIRRGNLEGLRIDRAMRKIAEKRNISDNDHVRGIRIKKIWNPMDDGDFRERTSKARNYIMSSKIKSKNYEYYKRWNPGFFSRSDIYKYKQKWYYDPETYLNEYRKYYHRIWVQYQEYWTPKMVVMCQNYRKYKRHERRVNSSWRFLLNKQIPIKEKVNKFLEGDLWLQLRVDPKHWGWGWGKEWEKHNKGEKSAYDDTAAASYYGFHTKTEQYIGWSGWVKWQDEIYTRIEEFKHVVGLHRKWKWINPKDRNNRYFLRQYWRPWVKHLQETKQPVYGNAEKPDIFWFEFVRRDIFYLRKADGALLDHDSFKDAKLLKIAEHAWERIWWKGLENADITVKKDFYIWKNFQKIQSRLPAYLVPDHVWVKKYKYKGPKLWRYIFNDVDYLDGQYFGPHHLPISIRYSAWYDCMRQSEALIAVRRFCFFFGLNYKTLSFIPNEVWSFIFFFSIIWLFFFFLTNHRLWDPIQCRLSGFIPKLHFQAKTNKGINRTFVIGFYRTKESIARGQFNMAFYTLIHALILASIYGYIFEYKCYFFSPLNFPGWFYFIGSMSFVVFVRWYLIKVVTNYIRSIEDQMTRDPQFRAAYQAVLKHELQLTINMRNDYEEKLRRARLRRARKDLLKKIAKETKERKEKGLLSKWEELDNSDLFKKDNKKK